MTVVRREEDGDHEVEDLFQPKKGKRLCLRNYTDIRRHVQSVQCLL